MFIQWQAENQLAPEQVVLIVDPQLPRVLWPVSRIIITHPGVDEEGDCTATIMVKVKTYVPPATQLTQMPDQ